MTDNAERERIATELYNLKWHRRAGHGLKIPNEYFKMADWHLAEIEKGKLALVKKMKTEYDFVADSSEGGILHKYYNKLKENSKGK